MTDEAMAEKYAFENRESCMYDDRIGWETDHVARKQAFLAGLKAGRPKWHKVADGDLPEVIGDYITNVGVLTYDHYGNNIYKWHTPFCEACDYGDKVDDDEVVAWCEIPEFREAKQC